MSNYIKIGAAVDIMLKQRAIGFWALGTLSIFFAMFLTSGVQSGEPNALAAYAISLLLVFVGGMFWISVGAIEEKK